MFLKILHHDSALIDPTFIEPPASLFKRRGCLIILIDGPEELKNSLEGTVNLISHEYFEDTKETLELSPLPALKRSLQKSHLPSNSVVFAFSLVEDTLYIAAIGQGQLQMIRGGKDFTIFSNLKNEVLAASGKVRSGDQLQAAVNPNTEAPTRIQVEVIAAPDVESQAETPALVQIKKKLSSFWSSVRRTLEAVAAILRLKKEVKLKRPSGKRLLTALLLVFLTTLGSSVYYSVYTQQQLKRENEFNALAVKIEKDINDAYSIKNLNLEKAHQIYKASEEDFKKLQALGFKDERVATLETKLAVLASDLQRKIDTKFELVVDLANLKINPVDFTYQGENFYVLASNGEIKSISKDRRVVPLAKVEGATLIRSTKERLYTFAPSGLYRIDGTKAVKLVEPESRWRQIVDVFAYNSNVYLLDQGAKSVWKYVPGGNGLVFGSNGVGDEGSKMLKKPSSLAIDGNIWVTDENAAFKFLLEKKENFSIRGFDQKISSETRLYTTTDDVLRSLLILDKGLGRVIQVNKSGQFENQYSGEEIRQALNISYNAATKQVLLLTPTKIVGFKLE